MDKDNKAIRTRAFHVAYALIRLSRGTGGAFSSYFEKYALQLMDAVVPGSFKGAEAVLDSIDYSIKLASEVGVVGPRNFDIIEREIGLLRAEFGDLDNSAMTADIDLGSIFSSEDELGFEGGIQGVAEDNSAIDYQDAFLSDSIQAPPQESMAANGDYEVNSAIAQSSSLQSRTNPEMRQSAILDKIRQKGYCRLKDIQESFPDTSERTLRYDLQHLIEIGMVERIGSGGPASFYRVQRSGGEGDEVREV